MADTVVVKLEEARCQVYEVPDAESQNTFHINRHLQAVRKNEIPHLDESDVVGSPA